MSDLSKTLLQLAGGGVVAAAAMLASLYLLRTALAGAVTRAVNRDLEQLRADMNKSLELLRHELRLEAHKAEIVASKKNEVYPEALAAVRATFSMVAAIAEVTRSNAYIRPADLEPAKLGIKDLRERIERSDLHFGPKVLKTANEVTQTFESVVSGVERAGTSFRTPILFGMPGGSGMDYSVRHSLDNASRLVRLLEEQMRSELNPPEPPSART